MFNPTTQQLCVAIVLGLALLGIVIVEQISLHRDEDLNNWPNYRPHRSSRRRFARKALRIIVALFCLACVAFLVGIYSGSHP